MVCDPPRLQLHDGVFELVPRPQVGDEPDRPSLYLSVPLEESTSFMPLTQQTSLLPFDHQLLYANMNRQFGFKVLVLSRLSAGEMNRFFWLFRNSNWDLPRWLVGALMHVRHYHHIPALLSARTRDDDSSDEDHGPPATPNVSFVYVSTVDKEGPMPAVWASFPSWDPQEPRDENFFGVPTVDPRPTRSATRRTRTRGFVDVHATECVVSRSFVKLLNFDLLSIGNDMAPGGLRVIESRKVWWSRATESPYPPLRIHADWLCNLHPGLLTPLAGTSPYSHQIRRDR